MSDVTAEVEAILREHAYIPTALRGVSKCGCGIQMHGMPHDHRAHVAEVIAARLADRDAAGVEARVRALADEWEAEAAEPFGRWFQHEEAAADLRAALSGPADEHPADGTSA